MQFQSTFEQNQHHAHWTRYSELQHEHRGRSISIKFSLDLDIYNAILCLARNHVKVNINISLEA